MSPDQKSQPSTRQLLDMLAQPASERAPLETLLSLAEEMEFTDAEERVELADRLLFFARQQLHGSDPISDNLLGDVRRDALWIALRRFASVANVLLAVELIEFLQPCVEGETKLAAMQAIETLTRFEDLPDGLPGVRELRDHLKALAAQYLDGDWLAEADRSESLAKRGENGALAIHALTALIAAGGESADLVSRLIALRRKPLLWHTSRILRSIVTARRDRSLWVRQDMLVAISTIEKSREVM